LSFYCLASQEGGRSSLEEEREMEARVKEEAESIQRTLPFPVNTNFIAGLQM